MSAYGAMPNRRKPMAKAESKEKGKERSYPCPICRSDHTSVTTYLGMISSRALMSWMGKNGIAKLNVLADQIKRLEPESYQASFDAARVAWESVEDTQFWKSAKQIGQDAADIGTMAHGWIEAHLNGKEITMDTFPLPAQNCINGYLAWEKDHKVKVIKTEQTFYHCVLDYAGTADAILEIDGELTMVDWKTSNAVYSNYVIQDWLYALADESQHGDRLYKQVAIGRFGKTGDWEMSIHKRNDFPSIELARRVIEGCKSIYELQTKWDALHPYVRKEKQNATPQAK
jgi:hypothetical protein